MNFVRGGGISYHTCVLLRVTRYTVPVILQTPSFKRSYGFSSTVLQFVPSVARAGSNVASQATAILLLDRNKTNITRDVRMQSPITKQVG